MSDLATAFSGLLCANVGSVDTSKYCAAFLVGNDSQVSKLQRVTGGSTSRILNVISYKKYSFGVAALSPSIGSPTEATDRCQGSIKGGSGIR
jgi:hypothetical protein